MGGISIWQLAIVGILVVLLFGRGKISELMGDVAKGIKSFKKGMKDEDTATVGVDGKPSPDPRIGQQNAMAPTEAPATEPIDVTPPKQEREGA